MPPATPSSAPSALPALPDAALHSILADHASHVRTAARHQCGGNEALAQDVTQAVLCELVRSASRLPEPARLQGWLRRCVFNKAAAILRAEARRKRREQEAAALHGVSMPVFHPDADGTPPGEVLRVLEESLASLSLSDREALILRFYEGRSLREVGERMGVTGDTAQKRVARALIKLRAHLLRRGVTKSSLSLSAPLTAVCSSFAALPVLQGVSVSSHSTASTSLPVLWETLLHTLTTMTAKSKLTLATAGLCALLAVPAALQQRTISRLRAEISSLRNASPPLPGLSANQQGRSASGNRPSFLSPPAQHGAPEAGNTARVQEILREPDPLRRMTGLTALLRTMSPTEALEIARQFEALEHTEADLGNEFHLFLRAWGGLDGPSAAAWLTSKPSVGAENVAMAMSGWASRSPLEAVSWLAGASVDNPEQLAAGIAHGWALTDLDSAARWIETRPRSDERTGMQNVLFRRLIETRGLEGARQWFAGISPDPGNEVYRQRAFDKIASRFAMEEPDQGLQWLTDHAGQPFAASASTIGELVSAKARQDPAAAAQWAVDHAALRASDGRPAVNTSLASAISIWAAKDMDAAGNWLNARQDAPGYDSAAATFAEAAARVDRQAGLAWADTIRDPAIREKTLSLLSREWLTATPGEARNGLLQRGLTAEQIDDLSVEAAIVTVADTLSFGHSGEVVIEKAK